MTATTRLVLRSASVFRDHLEMLTERGQKPVVVGADDQGRPFLLSGVEGRNEEKVYFGDKAAFTIHHLVYPVTLLQVLS